MLTNITVTLSDLQSVKSDIVERYDPDNTIFSGAITAAKRELYGRLKLKLQAEYPDYDNTELDTLAGDIKDLPNEQYLKWNLSHLAVAKILEHNDLVSDAAYYRQLAGQIPLIYYLDTDDSGTVGTTEQVIHHNVVFGR